jgi:hypothetical protein
LKAARVRKKLIAPPRALVKPLPWVRELAAPYLRGYRAVAERRGGLRGYWFLTPGRGGIPRDTGPKAAASAGFFVGYLLEGPEATCLFRHPPGPQPPECLVFAFVAPAGGDLHRRLVGEPGSLMRKTFEYIRWLTHRPPRFIFEEDANASMTRHASMRDWPRGKYEHFSRNFFIESLAWLVRSGLVRKLLVETAERDVPEASSVRRRPGHR